SLTSMIFNLFRKPPVAPDAVHEIYRSIVAQSRQERFYADWGVADTVTGRFDMVSLHLALYLRRLKNEPSARVFTQALVELFFKDMDRSIRELGVTDLGVPKKIKTMGNVFYGLVNVLAPALDSGVPANVEAALVRNVYGSPNPGAALLAAYLLDESVRLAALSAVELVPASGIAA
ncbi:MAG: ubiquinol-cytochrome C chaperone family protein, partial [Devosia sp.]